MSTNRRRTGAWTTPPKGPSGEPLCRQCRGPVKSPRRTFCSDDCVDEWRLRSDPGYLRGKVFERDKGVCAVCGRDTEALSRELRVLRRESFIGWRNRKRELGIPDHRSSLWDADHVTPVADGGGECGIEGIRTLCHWCHKTITAEWWRSRKGGP